MLQGAEAQRLNPEERSRGRILPDKLHGGVGGLAAGVLPISAILTSVGS